MLESIGLMILFPEKHFPDKNKGVFILFFQLVSQSVMSVGCNLYAAINVTWIR